MNKKTGLGKGLDALFSDNTILEDKEEKINDDERIQKIKIIDIEPNKDQPRKKFDTDSLDELAESIKRYGVIQPIIVSRKENYFEIIAGERRWRASKKAGLTEIPCIVREQDEKKNKEIALIENIQRQDLNPIEKARGFKQLMEEYGITQMQLSEIIGISRSAIANTVRILNLDERVIELALNGQLTEGHCRSLMSFSDPEKQYEIALQIIKSGDSVRDIERKVKNTKQLKKKDQKYEAIYRDIEDTFKGFFGTPVKLNAGKRKGKIIMLNQFSRTELLLGKEAMEKLGHSRVAVFGVGGVGGYVCEALVRSGVGAFDLIDDDKVCLTNLNRQIIATRKTVGKYKAEVMRDRILEINPEADVRIHKCFFLPENADDFPFDEYDYIVDAVDTVTAKIELVMKAKEKDIPIISSMGAGNKLDGSQFKVADIYKTKVCPLAKVMRRELKKRGVKKLKVVYSEEIPTRPIEDMAISCRTNCICPPGAEHKCTERRDIPGSVAFVPSVAGLIIAGEVVKDLIRK